MKEKIIVARSNHNHAQGYNLRQNLFDVRSGNSSLAKSLSEKVTMQCTKKKAHTETFPQV